MKLCEVSSNSNLPYANRCHDIVKYCIVVSIFSDKNILDNAVLHLMRDLVCGSFGHFIQ